MPASRPWEKMLCSERSTGVGRSLSRITRSTKSGPGRCRRSRAMPVHSWPRRSSAPSPRIDSMRSMPLAELVMAMPCRLPSRACPREAGRGREPPRLARQPRGGRVLVDGIEGLGSFYLGKPYDVEAKQAEDGYVLYDSKDLTTHARLRRHDRQRQDRPLPGPDRGGRDRRHARDRDRPQGRPRQPAAHLPRPAPGGLPALDQRGRRRQGRRLARRLRQGAGRAVEEGPRRLGPGRRAHPARCATRPTSRSTRRAATPACPSRSSARSRRRRDRSRRGGRCGEQIGATATSLLALLGIDADPIKSREHILLSSILERGLGARARRSTSPR